MALVLTTEADSVRTSIGVNIKWGDFASTQGAYFAHWSDKLIPTLKASGIPYARGGSRAGSGDSPAHHLEVYQRIRDCVAAGVKISALPILNTTGAMEYDFAQADNGWFQIEGRNEAGCLVSLSWQEALYANVKASSILQNLPVAGPGLVGGWCLQTNFAPYCDKGNDHTYIHGNNPEAAGWMHTYYNQVQNIYSGKPPIASELGHRQIAPGELAGQNHVPGVPPDVRSRYIVRWVLSNLLIGWKLSIFHQFAENHQVSATDSEYGYGLLDINGAPTPAWTALSNLIRIYNDPGPPFTPAPLDFTLGGAFQNVEVMICQKRNGHWLIAFWIGMPCWDDVTYTRVTVPQQKVLLALPSITQAMGNRFNAVSGTLHHIPQFATNGQVVSLYAHDDLTVLEVW
jgi:hypothetical protein